MGGRGGLSCGHPLSPDRRRGFFGRRNREGRGRRESRDFSTASEATASRAAPPAGHGTQGVAAQTAAGGPATTLTAKPAHPLALLGATPRARTVRRGSESAVSAAFQASLTTPTLLVATARPGSCSGRPPSHTLCASRTTTTPTLAEACNSLSNSRCPLGRARERGPI